ncbi:mating alpha-pheromone PpgA [Aspergillus campestris IBT 28561]|uniref:Mating alpha-pheromone PpgA n=1 Tax=Aspergillus campestris (strain IBT 28561) TaxID=1392248 RepID=A0A2I1D2A6_ASPC2|nr:mating alpha-pheromone PpgA [Aspergillus campestris IBT 28561]PKY03999.1 mating alpha-pheromone PpgA [Aspergillus campestris IBT 28561]
MKLVTLVLASLAATTVQGAAMQIWCHFPGQGCYMLKRAADATGAVKRSAEALAEAMPDPEAVNTWCHFPGQGCQKAKRAAEAIGEVKRSADALAEAMAALEEEDEQ